jgi:hypothetical protein
MAVSPASALSGASRKLADLASQAVHSVAHQYHEVGSAILALCAALDRTEAAGLSCGEMRELVGEARASHALSPFLQRLQVWPRGYPGDFETIDHLLTQENRAVPGTFGFVIEQYCLATALAQQHRNKTHRQAHEVLQTLLQANSPTNYRHPPKVLILAAGSSPELRLATPFVRTRDFRAVLCDTDAGAIACSKQALSSLGDRIVTLEGDVVWCADSIQEHGPYDLIVTGGLFDYLDDKWATKTLDLALNEWLTPGGKLFFTNLATENPFRLWMRCIVDWNVIERTEVQLRQLVAGVRTDRIDVQVQRDPSTLALMAVARLTDG